MNEPDPIVGHSTQSQSKKLQTTAVICSFPRRSLLRHHGVDNCDCMMFLQFSCSLLVLLAIFSTDSLAAAIEYCHDNNHISGSWVENNNISKKSFVCDILANHPAIEDTNEKYVYHNGSMPYERSGGCSCDETQGTTTSVSNREKYEWLPNNCTLRPWNATEFCRLLGERNILLSGDSTMHQTFSTLSSMVAEGNGSCGPQLTFGLSHLLTVAGYANWRVVDHITKHKPFPDIVVITVGAHLADMGDLQDIWDNVDTGLRHILKWLRDNTWRLVGHDHDIKWIWKTQNPGHMNCTAITSPLSTPNAITEDDPRDKFHWGFHKHFDELSMKWAKEEGMKVIDMSPLDYRWRKMTSSSSSTYHYY